MSKDRAKFKVRNYLSHLKLSYPVFKILLRRQAKIILLIALFTSISLVICEINTLTAFDNLCFTFDPTECWLLLTPGHRSVPKVLSCRLIFPFFNYMTTSF